jgi:hypothetical protein
MRSISRLFKTERPSDGIAPSAIPAPWRAPAQYASDDYTPLRLAPEDPNLLRDYARGTRGLSPSCLILGASRADHERMRHTASLANALEFELAVAQNTLILHPGDPAAERCLELLQVALPAVTDHQITPLAVTR